MKNAKQHKGEKKVEKEVIQPESQEPEPVTPEEPTPVEESPKPGLTDNMKTTCSEIGKIITGTLPEGYGYFLTIFAVGEGGEQTHSSNADRGNVKTMMSQWLQKTKESQ